jgi:transposase
MRCLKRRLSDVVFHALQLDLQERLRAAGPEGHSGTTLTSSATDLTPVVSSSDKSLTGPASKNATRRSARVKVPS